MSSGPDPSSGLIYKTIFKIINTHCSQRAFGKIENFVAIRWALACYKGCLIVAIQMHLISGATKILAGYQFRYYTGITSCRQKSREPVHSGKYSIFDFPRWDMARPA